MSFGLELLSASCRVVGEQWVKQGFECGTSTITSTLDSPRVGKVHRKWVDGWDSVGMATTINFLPGTDVEVSLLERAVASAEEAHREAVVNPAAEFLFPGASYSELNQNLVHEVFSFIRGSTMTS